MKAAFSVYPFQFGADGANRIMKAMLFLYPSGNRERRATAVVKAISTMSLVSSSI